MQSQYQKQLEQIQKPHSASDRKLIEEAFYFAQKAHGGQKRSSGEDYIAHPIAAALTLSNMNVDAKTISAGLLHDVVDDTEVTLDEIEEKFGSDIAFLVDGVSKLGKIKYRGVERHAENLRKMLLAMARDFRVVLIKLADRYHNLTTLEALPAQKQRRIALESLEIYAPLAFRFGVSELSKQIEDIAFKYCYPQEYNMILTNIQEKYPQREKFLDSVKPYLRAELIKEGIMPLDIQTRAKHYWSLYEKLKRYNMNWDSIYDLVAMRIVVSDIEECYATLGIIHKLWKPLPGRIKDYIALPKPNGYQSIHTTVFCKGGQITEFQIRTREMHDAAEHGIAAHWLYAEKKGEQKTRKAAGSQFDWIKQLRQWQEHIKESEEFLDNLKIDVFSDRIFVFTPLGDVIDLPERATPIDFAYSIHGTLGDRCWQAKVNSEMASLDYELKNGDMVEIIKNEKARPSQDWLSFAKTNLARQRIRAYFKSSRREENLKLGEALINRELEKLNQPKWHELSLKQKDKALQNLPYKNEASLIAEVGEGNISAYRAIKYVIDEKTILAQREIPIVKPLARKQKISKVDIAGQSGIKTRVALCCSPLPKENVAGYITKTGTATIHKTNCSNLKRLTGKSPDRLISASWEAGSGTNFVKIKMGAQDRVGLMQEVSSIISNMGINMLSISAVGGNVLPKGNKEYIAQFDVTVEVFDIDQFHLLMRRLEQIKGIKEIRRA